MRFKNWKCSYTHIWCWKVQEWWRTILLGLFITWTLILFHERMTSIKRYVRHVLNIWYGKHIKIFNYHFSLEAWLERKWNNFPNFREISQHISFYLPQFLAKLNICVHCDFCCCVVKPTVCCCHIIPEQITHVNGFNQSWICLERKQL
jgi:hypothetical protein